MSKITIESNQYRLYKNWKIIKFIKDTICHRALVSDCIRLVWSRYCVHPCIFHMLLCCCLVKESVSLKGLEVFTSSTVTIMDLDWHKTPACLIQMRQTCWVKERKVSVEMQQDKLWMYFSNCLCFKTAWWGISEKKTQSFHTQSSII